VIYSRACEYAIRGLAHLAERRHGDLVRLRDIARAEDIPQPFLAKVFQDLVWAGVLESARGRSGGYALARPAAQITLHEIREAIDGAADLTRCAVGLGECSDTMPCPLHDTFKPIRERIKQYLQRTTLADIARALTRKRALLVHTRSGSRS